MERKYQIFISSTYVDLIDERQEVTKQILNNYHFPVGMEMFAPSDKEQWEVIEKTIDSSDIYILLLGYRYGSVLNITDGSTKNERVISYTEMEFEYAVKKRVPIIVFIKEDSDLIYVIKKLEALSDEERCTVEIWKDTLKKIYGGNYGLSQIDRLKSLKTGPDVLKYIYDNKYDKDQAKIEEFRLKARRRLIGTFSKDKKIDVQNAIAQKTKMLPTGGWVKEQHIKRSYLLNPKYLLILCIILLLAVVITFAISESKLIKKRLINEDNELFDLSADSSYKLEFARVLPNNESLNTETASLGERIKTTEESFSIYTTTFQRLKDNYDEILNGARRGVKFRILLLDTSEYNYDILNRQWFYNPTDSIERNYKVNGRGAVRENIILVSTILSIIAKEGKKGTIELRFSKRPLYYGMWIKDPSRPDGIAHFTISHYDNFKPVFRVTAKSSRRLLDELNEEFKKAWDDTTNSYLINSRIVSYGNFKKIKVIK